MFSNLLKTRLRVDNRAKTPPARSSPTLEELESRFAPVTINTPTFINPVVQITPNFFNFTVTEKVTATITAGGPLGNRAGSTIFFNLNNQQQQAGVDSSGHAITTFTMPLLTVLTSQTLTAFVPGADFLGRNPGEFFHYPDSTFTAPLYLNFDNLLFPGTVSFGPPPAQSPTILPPAQSPSGLPPYNSAQGETDDFGLFSFQYVDPGLIASVQMFGQQFPGFFAAALGAYGPAFMNNGGSG
jgi:hypothetical protein